MSFTSALSLTPDDIVKGYDIRLRSSGSGYPAQAKAALWADLTTAELNSARSAEQARIARNWSEEMSNSQYQRAVADLRKSGLNPILAASNGGAGVPSASVGNVDTGASGSASDVTREAMSALVATNNMLLQSQTQLKSMEMSTSASQYAAALAASATTSAAASAAYANMYSSDNALAGAKYSSDNALKGSKYATDNNGSLYSQIANGITGKSNLGQSARKVGNAILDFFSPKKSSKTRRRGASGKF